MKPVVVLGPCLADEASVLDRHPHLAVEEEGRLLDFRVRDHFPAGAVSTLLRSWAERFEVAYLAEQVMFEPYPEALVSLLDSGKGREP